MLLSAVWSRSDTSTESIWLANSWRLCRHVMALKWVTRQQRLFVLLTFFFKLRATSRGSLCAHLAVSAGDADDDVVVGRWDGRAVDGHAVHPLFVTRNSHGGSGEPEELICVVIFEVTWFSVKEDSLSHMGVNFVKWNPNLICMEGDLQSH